MNRCLFCNSKNSKLYGYEHYKHYRVYLCEKCKDKILDHFAPSVPFSQYECIDQDQDSDSN